MARIIITHGSGGSPAENWFPWLAAEVRQRGHTALAPRYPTPDGQNLQNWLYQFDTHAGPCTNDTVLVAHSVGVAFNLHVLARSTVPVKACFFVAGFLGMLGLPEFDTLNASFVVGPFDWERIRKNSGHARLYHGGDDPYVPLAKGRELAGRLGAALAVVPHGGHLNAAAGYRTFELLLNDVLLVLKE